MKRTTSLALAALLAAGAAFAQDGATEESALGRAEYMIACAGCHGESGKGDGPLAGLLDISTPDLTELSKRYSGSFPFRNTLLLIDGRNDIRAHGSEMPVWGDRYMSSAEAVAMEQFPGMSREVADAITRGRLLSLVYYLESIQQ
ncbi:cytochrome c [Rhodosalinus halophilus]|uniref:Cytochrome c n=1 Tax=Rhodosalinus halophilus TaxID=2259333 RepID=A0A365UAT9_9RHOB|nr:cytochrome c [Rhodosalinus halophilus]RBI86156.1 cytochrome c [Rhodosalinus halophilus]